MPVEGSGIVEPPPENCKKFTASQIRASTIVLDGVLLSSKDTNPKDAVGATKPPACTVSRAFLMMVRRRLGYLPTQVVWMVGMGMEEGARKYGRHNYRVAGVRSSIYFDATNRHIDRWLLGEDIDPDSDLNHVVKAICSIAVVADACINGKLNDDRPPRSKYQWNRPELFDAQLITATDSIEKVQTYLDMWWEGAGDLDLLIDAASLLFKLADLILRDALKDDRLKDTNPEWMADLQERMNVLIQKYPNPLPPFTQLNHGAM